WGNRSDQLARTVAEERLIVAEEEQLVLHDRPTDRPAENVLRQVGFLGIALIVFPGIGGHAAVTPVLKANAVVFVRARLDCAADHGAGDVPEFSRVVVGLDSYFG